MKRTLLILLLFFGTIEAFAQAVPSGWTPNFRLRKYPQGANPGSDSLNANWTQIDAASFNGDKGAFRFRDSLTTLVSLTRYFVYKDTTKAWLSRSIAGDMFSITQRVRAIGRASQDSSISVGIEAVSKAGDSSKGAVRVYADGTVRITGKGVIIGPGSGVLTPGFPGASGVAIDSALMLSVEAARLQYVARLDSLLGPGYVTRTQNRTDSLYRAAQEAAIRAVQAADSTYKAAQIALKVAKVDSASMPGYATRTMLQADSLYRAAQEALMVKKADSTIAAGYATRTMLQADSLYRKAQEATKQSAIANLADTSKYLEYADSSKSDNSGFARVWQVNAKQATISNLADTSKYMEYPDTNTTIATTEYVRTHSSGTTVYQDYNPATSYTYFDDFDGPWSTGATSNLSFWRTWSYYTMGTSAGGNLYQDSTSNGVIRITAQHNGYTAYPSAIGSQRFYLSTTGSQPWTLTFRAETTDTTFLYSKWGFSGNASDFAQTGDNYDEICFRKKPTHHLVAVTRSGSVETETDCGEINLLIWHGFKIGWTSSGIQFYVDGTLKATHTTNIMVSSQQSMVFGEASVNQAGGTGVTRYGYIDYVLFQITGLSR
jgi:hypothetical protein